jgi:hypothetical protein
MKLLKRHIEKDGSGSVSLRLEYDEDLWHGELAIAQKCRLCGTVDEAWQKWKEKKLKQAARPAYNLIQEVHSLSPAQTSSLPHLDDLLTYCREMKCGQQQSGG